MGPSFSCDASVLHERVWEVDDPELRRRLDRVARAFDRNEAVIIEVRPGGKIVAKNPV